MCAAKILLGGGGRKFAYKFTLKRIIFTDYLGTFSLKE
jgi:hypothetical protein